MQEVYWRLMPGIDNRREESGLGRRDAGLTKSWPTQPGPPKKRLPIKKISM